MNTLKILLILTSSPQIGDTGEPTGVWLEEMTTPYYYFIDQGAEVDIASIEGGEIPVDPRSLGKDEDKPASVLRYLEDETALAKAKHSIDIDEVEYEAYDAIFLPGGHGTMFDLPESEALANLLAEAWSDDKVIAAVCHGPAGLVSVVDESGTPLVKGKQVAGFTNSEEDAVGLTEQMPFLLESRLRELGAIYQSGSDFQPFAVRDGNLVTGQNPASSERTAQLVLEALNSQK